MVKTPQFAACLGRVVGQIKSLQAELEAAYDALQVMAATEPTITGIAAEATIELQERAGSMLTLAASMLEDD